VAFHHGEFLFCPAAIGHGIEDDRKLRHGHILPG
jgi:hypothetical protein